MFRKSAVLINTENPAAIKKILQERKDAIGKVENQEFNNRKSIPDNVSSSISNKSNKTVVSHSLIETSFLLLDPFVEPFFELLFYLVFQLFLELFFVIFALQIVVLENLFRTIFAFLEFFFVFLFLLANVFQHLSKFLCVLFLPLVLLKLF